MKIGGVSVSITQVYAPTEAASDDEIEAFYEDIERTILQYETQQKFIIGDFTSKVGQKLQIEETQIGPHGLGTRNSRGSRLIQFAQENRLYIMNTFFKKCPSSKWTWQSPDGRTRNEIDYILSDRRGNIRDIEVATNLKFDTDPRMVQAAVTLDCRRRYFVRSRKPEAEKIIKDIYTRPI